MSLVTNRSRCGFCHLLQTLCVWNMSRCRLTVGWCKYYIDLCAVGGRGCHLTALFYSAMWTGVPCGLTDIYALPDFRVMCFLVQPVRTSGTFHAIQQVSGTNWSEFCYWPEDGFVFRQKWQKFGQHRAVVLVQSRISVVIRVNAKNWMLWHPFIYDSTTVLDRQLRQSLDDTATT